LRERYPVPYAAGMTKAKNTGATTKKKAVSLATILEHVESLRSDMQKGEQRLMTHIADARTCLLGEIKNTERRLTARMDGLEKQIKGVETNLSRQIDGIDKRLDAIEIEKLPQRVAAIETAVGVARS
jgi:predicted  nucleic acid-binding Zn-ribbon protein